MRSRSAVSKVTRRICYDRDFWHPLKKLKELYLLQVAEFAELEHRDVGGCSTQGSTTLHNLLNTKPLHFSEREQQYGLSNVNLSIVTIEDDIGVVKMVIDWECVM